MKDFLKALGIERRGYDMVGGVEKLMSEVGLSEVNIPVGHVSRSADMGVK